MEMVKNANDDKTLTLLGVMVQLKVQYSLSVMTQGYLVLVR